MITETQRKILGEYYDQWFRNYPIGPNVNSLGFRLGATGNEIPQAVEILSSNNLIEPSEYGYVISAYGIEKYEEGLPPSLLSQKKQEKKIILDALLQLYNIDIHRRMSSEELNQKIQINEYNYLLGIIVYLGKKGLVDVQMSIGGKFTIRLNAYGFQSMQDRLGENSDIMTNAYKILFVLENSLRQYIETRLRSKFETDWWENGISLGLKRKVNQMKEDESRIGWTVNVTNSDLQYLMYEHLQGIIANNWKEVFEQIFKDQQKIVLRLSELEIMRNSIAHTRTLSMQALVRLEQYSSDLFNLMGLSP